jgi:hypothetical protein
VQDFVIDLDSVLSKCVGALRSFHGNRSHPAGLAVRGIRSQGGFHEENFMLQAAPLFPWEPNLWERAGSLPQVYFPQVCVVVMKSRQKEAPHVRGFLVLASISCLSQPCH